MGNIQFKVLKGLEAAPFVDEFYADDGRSSRARENDIFIIGIDGDKVVASCRLAIEEGVRVLRSMLIHRDYRGQELGKELLFRFENTFMRGIKEHIYCVPYTHLEDFYGLVGFKKINSINGPDFLHERVREYRAQGLDVILMYK